MKILQINSVCGYGSTGRIVTDLADVLIANGHECRIAYGRCTAPEKYKQISIRIGSDFDVKVHGAMTRIFDKQGFCSWRATEMFLQWMEAYSPDVVHLHNLHGYYINVQKLFEYLKTHKQKVVWTLHDCWAFTGHCAYFDYIGCERWKTGCFSCPQKREYPASIAFDASKNNWIHKKEAFTGVEDLTIVTPSEWLATLVRESFLKEYPVKVINNGIDLERFYPLKNDFKEFYKLEDKKILLGVASVWDKRKGLEDFIKLAGLIDDSYRIVLVGLTEAQISEMPKNVVGLKKTNSIKELAAIYSSADWFLNLTYSDTYPTVNLEAIACGCQVITYDTGGSIESVREYGGVVVNKGDIQSIKDIIYTNRSGLKNKMKEKHSKTYFARKYCEELEGGGIST